MLEIKAGAELREFWQVDEMVAKAIELGGYRYEGEFNFIAYGPAPDVFDVRDGPDKGQWPFEPSRDLRVSFWAAELVATGSFSVDWHKSYGWCAEIDGRNYSTFAETPALAICAAILALAK